MSDSQEWTVVTPRSVRRTLSVYNDDWIDKHISPEGTEYFDKLYSDPRREIHRFLKEVYTEVINRGNRELLLERIPRSDKSQDLHQLSLNEIFAFLGKQLAERIVEYSTNNDGKPYVAEIGCDTLENWILKREFDYLHNIIENGIIRGDPRKITDYKLLLKKYINHVGRCEGTIFISKYWFEITDVFNVDEQASLRALINRRQ